MRPDLLKRLQDGADDDGFNFIIRGTIGHPPYSVETTDGQNYLLRSHVTCWNGATHREIFDRAMAEGQLYKYT